MDQENSYDDMLYTASDKRHDDELIAEAILLWNAIEAYIDMIYSHRRTRKKIPYVQNEDMLFCFSGEENLEDGSLRRFKIKIPKNVLCMMSE